MTGAALDLPGRLPENVVHFAQALRRAGINVGAAETRTAIEALTATGFRHRADFHAALRAVMVTRASQLDLFDQVFALFWRDPEILEKMMHTLSPLQRGDGVPPPPAAAERRASEALGVVPEPPEPKRTREKITFDARLSLSGAERLGAMDFEQMSGAELAEAEAAIRTLTLPVPRLSGRRTRPGKRGRAPDLGATLRASLRRGGEMAGLARRAPSRRRLDLVVLCDISGSMSVYSRLILVFIHALTHAPARDWGHVHAFTFGTRLTNVTRALAQRDPDAALAALGASARDWSGGTRIGEALERFNKDWSRRVLGSGASVLLVTDGLERGAPDALGAQAERLSLSCRRLLWLNPLLRFEGFSPEAGGVRALLPHVDGLYACHSLASVADLATSLSGPGVLPAMRRP